MSTGKAGCGDRPHWLFRPLFRFQGARPEGAQSEDRPELGAPGGAAAGESDFAGNNLATGAASDCGSRLRSGEPL